MNDETGETDLLNPPGAEPLPAASTPRPEPTPAAPPPPAAAAPDQFAGQRDSLNREWNPVKFRLKDGVPQLDTKGRFVPSGLGKPARGDDETPDRPPTDSGSRLPPDEMPSRPEDQPLPADVTVDVAIGMFQAILIMVGEDEGILTDPEKTMLRGPLLRLIRKHNLGDKMTPEMETLAALAVAILARLKKPKTQGFFQRQLGRVQAWWVAQKIKRAAPVGPITV